MRQYFLRDTIWQWTILGSRAENYTRARTRRARDLAPQGHQILMRHPILGIEQNIPVEAAVRLAPQEFDEIDLVRAHARGC